MLPKLSSPHEVIFCGSCKERSLLLWRHFVLVFKIDRWIFRNLYLFGVTWHWYWSASLSLSAFLCYRLISIISSNWLRVMDKEIKRSIIQMIKKNDDDRPGAFLCYCLISKMAQTSNKGCWREQSQEIMISKNNVSHCQRLISKISSNWQRRVMEVTFPKDCWWTKTMWKW